MTIVEPSVYPDELVNPLCAELEKYPMVGAAYLQIMVINGATKSYLLVLDAPRTMHCSKPQAMQRARSWSAMRKR